MQATSPLETLSEKSREEEEKPRRWTPLSISLHPAVSATPNVQEWCPLTPHTRPTHQRVTGTLAWPFDPNATLSHPPALKIFGSARSCAPDPEAAPGTCPVHLLCSAHAPEASRPKQRPPRARPLPGRTHLTMPIAFPFTRSSPASTRPGSWWTLVF
jgi:hypothetical protein